MNAQVKNKGIAARLSLQPNEQTTAADGSNLGKPTIKLEFETNEELQKFFKDHEENLIDSYVEDAPDYEKKMLNGYGDVYEVTDLRIRSKKEPYQVKTLSTDKLDIRFKEKGPEGYKPVKIDYEFYKQPRINKPGKALEYTFNYRIASDGSILIPVHSNILNKANGKADFTFARRYLYSQYTDSNKDGEFDFEAKGRSVYYNLRQDKKNVFFFDIRLEDAIMAILAAIDSYKKKLRRNSLDYQILLDIEPFYNKISEDLMEAPIAQVAGLGKSPDKYNYTLQELNCKGMKPTFRELPDYGHLINEKALSRNDYKGDGFNVTEQTLINTVAEHWRTVAPLAKHLKADTERQSAFNVWYWMQQNLNYNYDDKNTEQIRTPARTWKDRKRGVDCDCLAVFAYCLFLNMGYRPKFEIIAFMGRDCWAHIFVNLGGMAVDRVLATFDQRPALISKTKMLEVPVYQLSGPSQLDGLADTVLRRINDGTATPEDCCNYRKVEAMRRFNGYPVEQKALAMFMPYIKDVDLTDGSIYFMPQYSALAEIARWADSKLIQLADKQRAGLQGDAYAAELNGIFKKIGNAIKKAVTAPVKAVVNTTKAAVKSTVNAVKATANVVKAGVQAATGNTAAAKETIQKAGQQAKSAVVDPVKTEVQNTQNVVADTVVNPTVTAVKATVELVKVLLVKINPVTVLMRNALRCLVAINFLGMAERLYIGYQDYEESKRSTLTKAGYSEADIEKATKAYQRVMKFFTKMGGDASKMQKSIVNGSKRKALFKKDYKNTQVINDDDTLSGLGEAVTIGSCLAAVGAFFVKIWNWIKDIVPKAASWLKDNKDTINTVVDIAKSVSNNGNSTDTAATTETTTTETSTTTSEGNGKKWLLIVAGGLAIGGVLMSGKGNKKKNSKK